MNFYLELHSGLQNFTRNLPIRFQQAPLAQNCKTSSDQVSQKGSPKIKKLAADKAKRSYHWKSIEHEKYILFLKQRKDLFELPYKKKIVVGIHTLMSKYIKSRSPQQCRSHHQKMMIKYKSVENIIISEEAAEFASAAQKARSFALKTSHLDTQQVPDESAGEVESLLNVSLLAGKPQSQVEVNCNMVQIMSEQFQDELSSDF